MKKSFLKLAGLALAAALASGVSGCSSDNGTTAPVHGHIFAKAWTYNETHHWKEALCDDTDAINDKAEHNFGEWKITAQPKEDAEGKRERECSVCHYKAEETFAKHVHIWNDGVVTKEPSTTEEGVKTFTCTGEGCGQTKTEVIGIPAGNVAKANFTINGTEIAKTSEIIVIPAGTVATIEMTDDGAWSGFVSSTADDKYKGVYLKNRKVKLSPFVMGQYPVTRDLYKAVMGEDPSTANSNETQGENPVNNVNWFNAIIFCNKLSALEGLEPVYSYKLGLVYETNPNRWINERTYLGPVPTTETSLNYLNWKDKVKIDITKNGYRLPTEAEWEFAARGGDPAKADWKYAFSGVNVSEGNMVYGTTYLETDSNLETVGWYYNKSLSGTHGVGLKKANALNLYDMSGNVWEWCNDFYNIIEITNDSAYIKDVYWEYSRVLRGGSWYDDGGACVVSKRYDVYPYACDFRCGFRVCRTAK